ncbi:MAG TPA: hypothetical protein VGL07_13405 [Buttiauxella sp.]
MNLYHALNIVSLDQCGAWQSVISANDMTKIHQAQDIILAARQRAYEHLQAARAHRLVQRTRFRRRLARQRHAWRRHYQRLFVRAKEDGAQAALHWLVDQHRWEQEACQRLTGEIARLMAARLREISQCFPWEELLFDQVGPLCQELQNQSGLKLKVATALYERLPPEVTSLPLDIECAENLPVGDAQLESKTVRVEIKLSGQIEQICNALTTLRWEQLYEPD